MKRAVFLSMLCAVIVAAFLVLAAPAMAQPLIEPYSPVFQDRVAIGQDVTFKYTVWGDWAGIAGPVDCTVAIRKVRGGRILDPVVWRSGTFTVSGADVGKEYVACPDTWLCNVKQGYYSWKVEAANSTVVSNKDSFHVVRHLR